MKILMALFLPACWLLPHLLADLQLSWQERNTGLSSLLSYWYIFVPLAVLITWLQYKLVHNIAPKISDPKNKGIVKLVVATVFLFFFFTTPGWLKIYNANWGTIQSHSIQSPVLSQYLSGKTGKSKKNIIRLSIDNDEKTFVLASRLEWNSYKDQPQIQVTLSKGSLGYWFKKKQ